MPQSHFTIARLSSRTFRAIVLFTTSTYSLPLLSSRLVRHCCTAKGNENLNIEFSQIWMMCSCSLSWLRFLTLFGFPEFTLPNTLYGNSLFGLTVMVLLLVHLPVRQRISNGILPLKVNFSHWVAFLSFKDKYFV